MPIIDNDFTPEEFEATIEAKPELLDSAVRSVLSKREFVVRSKDEETAWAANLENVHIAKHTSAYATQLEKDIEELTGIKKLSPTEKYYDYEKRALKALAEERATLKTEVDGYKGKSDISAAERQQLEERGRLLAEKETELADLKTNSEKSITRAKLENKIIQQMNTVTPKLIKSTVPGVERAKELVSNSVFEEIQEMASPDAKGNIILLDSNGKAIMNKDGSFTTVAQYHESRMNDEGFIDNGKQLPGAGGKGGKEKAVNIPGGAKTQVELMEWLRTNTMKDKSQKELIAEFDKFAHLLPR